VDDPETGGIAGRQGSDGKTFREDVSQIAGCRGIIPLPGCVSVGAAPLKVFKVLVFQTPLRGPKREHKKTPSHKSLRNRNFSLGRSGEWGQRPRPPREIDNLKIMHKIRDKIRESGNG
jgi:hypothetical protein